MDRDETSIGGIAQPMQPTKQLYYATLVMDAVAVLLSFLISLWFAAAVGIYIVCSRLYSYRSIRLKRFAIPGYLTVILNQGALTFFMVYHGATVQQPLWMPWHGLVAASFLIGGFYPITQVYQHKADAKDGVQSISMLLGIRGTFIFCAVMYAIALLILFDYYNTYKHLSLFFVIQTLFLPVLIYFIVWITKVWRNSNAADFEHTMRMNWLASTCTSLAFIIIIIQNYIG